MKLILGFSIATGCIFGGYLMAHGSMLALYQPAEFVIIAGGAVGAFIIANPPKVILATLKGLPGLFRGAKYGKHDFMEILALMYDLFSKARKEGLMALEMDVDEPHESAIFQKYPKLMSDHHITDFICDYLRLMVGGSMNAFELENLMDMELETHHHEASGPSEALATMSDGLPGFGIVAAVMGVVITMGFISEPPEVLGAHIAAALVGTFLGILLAYAYAAPVSAALGHRAADEGKVYECIKVCILATLNGYTPQIAVEFGRKVLFSDVRPAFTELEEHVKQIKSKPEAKA